MPRLLSLGLALSAVLSASCDHNSARYSAVASATTRTINTANTTECVDPKEELLSRPAAYLAGTPIYTTPSLVEKTGVIAQTYQQARQHWSNLEAQFSRVSSLSLYPAHPYRVGTANMENGQIYLYGAEERAEECPQGRDATLIHELAHLWHGFLLREDRRGFEQQWREISRVQYDSYSCDESRLYEPTHKINCRTSAKQAAAVTAYGGKSIEEDVAETMRFVYQVQKCPAGQRLPKNHTIIPENAERIIQKLGLLLEYGFIGEKEWDKAVGEIETGEGD